jgi:hypothetical protein
VSDSPAVSATRAACSIAVGERSARSALTLALAPLAKPVFGVKRCNHAPVVSGHCELMRSQLTNTLECVLQPRLEPHTGQG